LKTRLLTDHNGGDPVHVDVGLGSAWFYSARSPDKSTANEDAAVALAPTAQCAVLAVADGAGGHRAGEAASNSALGALRDRLVREASGEDTLRAAILDGFEHADRAVRELAVGAATTMAVAELGPGSIRPYHVGDSEIWVVGQRGKLKLQTLAHSPVGYAVEAGLLSEDEALSHEDRHLVSNLVGSEDMRIEVGSRLALAARDTVLIGSDGLFDNLTQDEIVEAIRMGPLEQAARHLAENCQAHMRGEAPLSKPDDLTFILFRLSR